MSNARDMLVIGDAMVDAYLHTTPAGVSDEAPVAVLDYVAVRRTPGGMMNVAASCAVCGAVRVIGLIGDDESGNFLRTEAARLGIETHWFSDGRPTIEKMRVLAGEQEAMLARVDVEATEAVDEALTRAMLDQVERALPHCGTILVSDYAKGLVTADLAGGLLAAAREHGVPVIVDAKPQTMEWFRGATLFTPNEREAREFAAQHGFECSGIDDLGATLANALDAAVLITRSAEGMTLFDRGGSRLMHFEGGAARAASTSGAGDVVVAAVGHALGRGQTLVEAVQFAGRCAARAVGRAGTCRLEPGDL